jgi:putative DNA primase/helicase
MSRGRIFWSSDVPANLYAVGGVEDRSSLRLPRRLLATRFARILKLGGRAGHRRAAGSYGGGNSTFCPSRGRRSSRTAGEHKFVFAYGTGANGKSTFTNTIAGIFGDYATVADMGTFIAVSTERHPTDVAKLHGYRLVIAPETEKGRRWDETKVKSMTGGDKMTARFMRCDFFDFVPQFKLWIVGNHKPRLDNVDEAMRRRMLLVPFTVQIPPEERDTDLPQKLKAEWPAILRWTVDGCLEWQRIGLAPPKIVTEATDQYFDDQDIIKQWLEDRIEDGGMYAFTPTHDLYTSWKAWCDERGMKPGIARALSDTLVDKGYIRKKGSGGVRGFQNLVIK